MSRYRISALARLFGLSRATLLYYDRVGLLPPSGRTVAGYRTYGEPDRDRLARIRALRQAGFSIEEVRELLQPTRNRPARLIARRLQAVGDEILRLRGQQRVLAAMLRRLAGARAPTPIDRPLWVALLRGAGLDADGLRRWHAEFERRAPQAHHDFLRELGLDEAEARAIRDAARRPEPAPDRATRARRRA